ncbi:MAG: hypothetical protein Q9170_007685 [Blastenia crenularia]
MDSPPQTWQADDDLPPLTRTKKAERPHFRPTANQMQYFAPKGESAETGEILAMRMKELTKTIIHIEENNQNTHSNEVINPSFFDDEYAAIYGLVATEQQGDEIEEEMVEQAPNLNDRGNITEQHDDTPGKDMTGTAHSL